MSKIEQKKHTHCTVAVVPFRRVSKPVTVSISNERKGNNESELNRKTRQILRDFRNH